LCYKLSHDSWKGQAFIVVRGSGETTEIADGLKMDSSNGWKARKSEMDDISHLVIVDPFYERGNKDYPKAGLFAGIDCPYFLGQKRLSP